MLQRRESGKARQYFIAIEKQMSKAKNTFRRIKSEMALLIENEALKLDNERMKPRSEFVEMVLTHDVN
jgi:regulator of replication initiation timing